MRSPLNSIFPSRSKPRVGCLGCLMQVLLILVLAGVGYLAIQGVFAPWGFFLGGPFHIMPYWQGWGRMHSKISGDYVLYVSFEPTSGGRGTYGGSWVKGTGYLCTAHEKFNMHLGGGMRSHLNLSTNGEAIHLYMDNWPIFSGGFITEHRPYLDLRGHWENPNIVMTDGGSLSRAFQPDGTVYKGHDPNRPYAPEIVSVTLNEGSSSYAEQACKSLRR